MDYISERRRRRTRISLISDSQKQRRERERARERESAAPLPPLDVGQKLLESSAGSHAGIIWFSFPPTTTYLRGGRRQPPFVIIAPPNPLQTSKETKGSSINFQEGGGEEGG